MSSEISYSRQPRENGANDDPVARLFRGLLRGLRRKNTDSLRETLDELIEERENNDENPIDDNERVFLSNILRLRDVTAYDVMVPRVDIVALDVKSNIEDVVQHFVKQGHSRIPVYRESLDDVIGMVHIKDILANMVADSPLPLSRILRRVLFVPPSMRVADLLLEMRTKRTHMALVVDEYGGIDGLVSIEDLVEQIVGEIDDEHDGVEEEPDIHIRGDGSIEADARTPIELFQEKLGKDLLDAEHEDIDTLGGLVFFLAGRVPLRGELIFHPAGVEFEVVEADSRRIKRVRVRTIAPDPI